MNKKIMKYKKKNINNKRNYRKIQIKENHRFYQKFHI